MNFYVYAYLDPRTHQPFYIGKGKHSRAYTHLQAAKKKRNGSTESGVVKTCRTLLKNGLTPRIVFLYENLSSEQALNLEVETIAVYKRKIDGGILENKTLGGEGLAGYKQTAEHIQKRVAKYQGRHHTDEQRAKMKGHRPSSEKRNIAAKERANRPDQKKRVSEFFTNFVVSEETKQKISSTMKKRGIKPPRKNGAEVRTSCSGTALVNGIIISFDSLKNFCVSIGINYSTARNTFRDNRPVTRGKFAGFQILSLTRNFSVGNTG
jgi:hypothetical protein